MFQLIIRATAKTLLRQITRIFVLIEAAFSEPARDVLLQKYGIILPASC